MLEALALSVRRGDRSLFENLSFSVKAGELLHVVGSNGAGKTTLLRTLCGLTRPDAGAVHFGQTDIRALGEDYRAQLAYVGHANAVQGELNAYENLHAVAQIEGVSLAPPDLNLILSRFDLAPYQSTPSKFLSQGQKRRLALARLALTKKQLWVLDEPFSALDQKSIGTVTELISAHTQTGGTVILTSHQEFEIRVTSLRLVLNA